MSLGPRWFARIRSIDLACPRCAQLYHIPSHSKRKYPFWDPWAQVFYCTNCKLKLVLGVLAWEPASPRGRSEYPPSDVLPTGEESRLLRLKVAEHRAHISSDTRGLVEGVNRLLENELEEEEEGEEGI